MNFVIPVALQIHFFSKNKNVAGYMQKPNRTLLTYTSIFFKVQPLGPYNGYPAVCKTKKEEHP